MSSFGNQFGFRPPPNMPPFPGTPAPSNPSPQQQQQFGSGFGSAQPSGGFSTGGGGFGASPAPSNFGGGFGTQQTNTAPYDGSNSFSSGVGGTPFGSSSTPSFGTASNQTPFGSSSVSSGGLNNTSPANMTGFGSSSTAAQTPFSTPAQTPFGQQQQQPSTSFGTNTGTPFGNSGGFSSQQQTPSAPSPFGTNTAAPSSAISFGVSSNIAPGVGQQQQGFGSANTPFSNASPAFAISTSSVNASPAFGVSTSNSFAPSSGFDNNEDMMDGGGGGGFGGTATTPFGASTSVASSPWTQASNARVPSPEPTSSGMQDSSMSPKMSPTPSSSTKEEELAQLKAKKADILRKKKKKLEELKRRKEAAAASSADIVPSASTLDASAPSFVPNEARSSRSIPDETASLADRNAARFAKPDTDDALLPEELRNRQGAIASGYKGDGPEEAQDIDNAVSLVGTCPYMCPDDELIRRQKEGDIQLLETPQPGTIHPRDWTLRNTAVKRFRRSAADYKLDVPAWVRPPDVLETVCGYLEEWVMERDRQGPDPRFPQSESPPSLDVYQFIWDRTRMVRKDFILQNYVGTGGKCDAAAVRCHERIARWHAMCEHQLSHIPKFVNAQSQQNIQEFGQAMKTLNMYYDDSLGRSIVEVPDEDGNETKTDLTGNTHGCSSQLVMGANPVDFDGTPLKNDASSIHAERRLIGPQAMNSPAHGTAEPEMRGLYILTTMNNDGGMEVLKYASYLHSNRPEVYNSRPVQLAMRIFKAKKEHNYAKFFSLLRDPKTPYLFACIMFKHVEQMRRYALRIMSRTYGGIVRKTKQTLEDQYPLKRLVRLLCFEDESEALEACTHYNITVEEAQVTNPNSPSATTQSVVYWRRSSFRDPKDPEKGFVLTLKPRKMIRTIESKLNGATRLAVCRGEVSGEGAALSSVSHPSGARTAAPATGMVTPPVVALSAEQVEAQQQQTEEQAAKRRMEERRRLREEQKRKEEEKRQQKETERKQKEEAKRQALLLKKQKEEEMKRKQAEEVAELRRKQAEEEHRRKIELEEAKRIAEAAAREEQLRREAEERRLVAERAEAQRKAEAERLEMVRQEELRKKREEEERLERIRREEEEKRRLEEERRRQEEERRRQEQLRLQREREEQERRRREEEARRIAAAKEAKMNQARKLLIWRRLRSKLVRELRKERTRQSLSRIDPTFSGERPAIVNMSSDSMDSADASSGYDADLGVFANLLPGIYVLDTLTRQSNPPLNLSMMLRKALCSHRGNASSLVGAGDVVLVSVAVVLPSFVGPKADAVRSLLHSWIGHRLQFGHVLIDLPSRENQSFEIRTVASNGNDRTTDCDMALLVIPPFFGDDSEDVYSSVQFPQLDGDIPRAILYLDNGAKQAYAKVVNRLLSSVPQDVPFFQVGGEELRSDLFDLSLEESCDALLQSYAAASAEGRTRGTLVNLPVAQLASRCIRSALWRDGVHPGTNEEHMIMDRARGVLAAMLAELKSLSSSYSSSQWSKWPAQEFVNRGGVVRNYFGDGLHLPAWWKDVMSLTDVESAVMELYKQLDGSSFREIIDNLTIGAPEHVKQDCREMLAKRQFRRCFEYVLVWGESNHEPSAEETFVYLPKQSVGDVVEGCIRRMGLDDDDIDDSLENNVSEELDYVEEADENAFSLELMQAMRSPAMLLEESTPRAEQVLGGTPASDGSRPLAESLKTPASNIMSPPVGVQTPATPPPGVQTPATSDLLMLRGSKRLLDSGEALRSSKRRRDSPLTKNEKESMAFTKKLESMLHGETVSDIKVGGKKLSDLLLEAPDVELP